MFLWVYWCQFGPFWCWNLFPELRLTMGSIIEWDDVMSISAAYRVSKASSNMGVNVVESCWICDRRSNFLEYSLKGVMYLWRWFTFESYMMDLSARLLILPLWSWNRKTSLLIWIVMRWNCGRFSLSPRQKDITRYWAVGPSTPSLEFMVKTTAIRRSKLF